jgi:4-hydroxy-tetrahydrodipicolinate reductase
MTGDGARQVRVGVVGAAGRMGTAVCDAVAADDRFELVAAVDARGAGGDRHGIEIRPDLRALADAEVDVAVDFTVVEAARVTLPWLALHGIHAVVGTTGFDDDDLDRFRSEFSASQCVIAANFAIGAVLMMRFAELAAPWFDTAEIVEFHHDAKVDAPSGTALATTDRMASALDRAERRLAPDPTVSTVLDGARGGVGPAGIRVHSLRQRGMVAHQEVLLGTTGQTLSIRHDSYDRTSFMPGVLLAVERVPRLVDPVTLGIESLLEL